MAAKVESPTVCQASSCCWIDSIIEAPFSLHLFALAASQQNSWQGSRTSELPRSSHFRPAIKFYAQSNSSRLASARESEKSFFLPLSDQSLSPRQEGFSLRGSRVCDLCKKAQSFWSKNVKFIAFYSLKARHESPS